MKLFVLEHNNVMQDIKKEFEIVSSIEEADKVLLWNDVNPIERGIITYAHSLGKKVIVLQHGRKGSSRYYPPFREPIMADKMLVWGQFDKDALIKEGNSPDKIEVVGTTVFNSLKGRKKHEGINIVFCPEHWDRPVEENVKVMKELKKLKGVNLITKIIESHDPKLFINPIVSHRGTPEHLDVCAEVLSTADLVVGVSESTFELMAQVLDIPVVIMEEWEPKAFGGDTRYTTYRRVISKGAKRATIGTLLSTIKQQLSNPGELQKERRATSIDEGGLHLNAIHEIKKAIVNA